MAFPTLPRIPTNEHAKIKLDPLPEIASTALAAPFFPGWLLRHQAFPNFFRAFAVVSLVRGALTKTVKAGVLREVLSGAIPQRASFDADLPINPQKGEQIVWAFAGSQYLEDKTRREFVGGSQGVSVRVMQGVYYRVGAFKGRPVEHTERVLVDTGLVRQALTPLFQLPRQIQG